MNAYNPQKPLISIHIPKCGGTSVSDILEAWFGQGFLRHYYDEIGDQPPVKYKLFKGIFRKKFRPGICIHGHFNQNRGIGIQDYYPEADQFITFLRDPFETHLSVYFYHKRLDKGAFREGKKSKITETNPTVRDYLKYSKKSHILAFMPPGITIDNYEEILEEKFVNIGIVEHLQKSVDQLAVILGCQTMKVGHQNISERPEEIPEGAREEFIENNPLEMAIYEYAAKKIF